MAPLIFLVPQRGAAAVKVGSSRRVRLCWRPWGRCGTWSVSGMTDPPSSLRFTAGSDDRMYLIRTCLAVLVERQSSHAI